MAGGELFQSLRGIDAPAGYLDTARSRTTVSGENIVICASAAFRAHAMYHCLVNYESVSLVVFFKR